MVSRWGYGVPHRLQRLFPDIALQYKDWTIPKNVSSTRFSLSQLSAFDTQGPYHYFRRP